MTKQEQMEKQVREIDNVIIMASAMIADKFNCQLEIDPETRTVNFIGDESQKHNIAIALAEIFD